VSFTLSTLLFYMRSRHSYIVDLPAAAGQLAGLLLEGVANALAFIIPLSSGKKRSATLAED
jgi:hypothetical protein